MMLHGLGIHDRSNRPVHEALNKLRRRHQLVREMVSAPPRIPGERGYHHQWLDTPDDMQKHNHDES